MKPDALRGRAIRALRKYRDAEPGDPARTDRLKDAAAALVDLREYFTTSTGEPDWLGATHAYKLAVRDVYSEAGMTHDEQVSTSGAVRYHAGNYLRAKLSEEEIEGLGLRRPGPRERHVERRSTNSQLLHALRSSARAMRATAEALRQEDGTTPGEEAVRSLAVAATVLEGIPTDLIAALAPDEQRAVLRLVTRVERACKRLREALG